MIQISNTGTQVLISDEKRLNVFRNFLLNKCITCNDKDFVWVSENIKSKAEFFLGGSYMLKMAKLKYNFSILKNYVHVLSDLVSSSKSSCKEKCQLFLQFTWKVFKIAKKNSIDFVSFGKSNACHWDQGKANVSMYFYIITAEILISKISWRTLGYIQLHLKIKILRNWYDN